MNMFALLYVLLIIGGAVLGGMWWPFRSVWLGGTLGALVVAGMRPALRLCMNAWDHWLPCRPVCQNGKCGPYDYEYLRTEGERSIFRCRCGHEYAKTGRVFYRDDQGSWKPYMRRGRLTGWKSLESPGTPDTTRA